MCLAVLWPPFPGRLACSCCGGGGALLWAKTRNVTIMFSSHFSAIYVWYVDPLAHPLGPLFPLHRLATA